MTLIFNCYINILSKNFNGDLYAKVIFKKLFKRSDDCKYLGKYYFYVKGHLLESNICGYISDGNDFFYSDTFYGLIKKLFQNPYNLNLGTWDIFIMCMKV